MKLPLFILLTSGFLEAQVVYIPNTDAATVRAMMNSNFAWLDANKLLYSTGTTLPPNCMIGQTFIQTNAPAGKNTYVALATGMPCTTWTLQGNAPHAATHASGQPDAVTPAAIGAEVPLTFSSPLARAGNTVSCPTCGTGSGTGASKTSDLLDCKVAIAGAVATIPTPCALTTGTVQHALVSNATATLSGTASSGTVYFYWSSNGTLTANQPTAATLTCSGCTAATTGVIPQGAWPIASATFASNSFTAVTDLRATYNTNIYLCGNGLTCSGLSTGEIMIDAAPGPVVIAVGSAALGTAAIASGTCAAAVSVTAAGVLATDVIAASFNADPTGVVGYQPSVNGMLAIIPYPTVGNVNFRTCNNTAASVTPGAITLNWRVTR